MTTELDEPCRSCGASERACDAQRERLGLPCCGGHEHNAAHDPRCTRGWIVDVVDPTGYPTICATCRPDTVRCRNCSATWLTCRSRNPGRSCCAACSHEGIPCASSPGESAA